MSQKARLALSISGLRSTHSPKAGRSSPMTASNVSANAVVDPGETQIRRVPRPSA